MSSMSEALQSNSNQGGALSQLPREIRDTIYRLLIKGRYVSWDDEYSCGPHTLTRPNLSILRVSQLIGHEAMEIMCSDSVFLFDIDIYNRIDDYVDRMFSQMKRVSPMMRNVEIGIDGYSLERAEWIQMQYPPSRTHDAKAEYAKSLKRTLDATMGLFEGVSIERRSLHIKFRYCCPSLLRSTHFRTICQSLKALVGFRTITMEIIPSRHMLFEERYYLLDDAEKTRRARELVPRITNALTEELQSAFGPAILAFNLSVDTPPTKGRGFVDGGDIASVGFLKFLPVKHSVERNATEKDKLQRDLWE